MKYRYQVNEKTEEVTVERQGETFRAIVDAIPFHFKILDNQAGELSLLFEGRPVRIYWAADGERKWISFDGCTYLLEKPAARRGRRTASGASDTAIRAPMPALVRSIEVETGEAVEKGQTLLLLEAMKMEIRVRAPQAGQVSSILVAAGESVGKDQLLMSVDG